MNSLKVICLGLVASVLAKGTAQSEQVERFCNLVQKAFDPQTEAREFLTGLIGQERDSFVEALYAQIYDKEIKTKDVLLSRDIRLRSQLVELAAKRRAERAKKRESKAEYIEESDDDLADLSAIAAFPKFENYPLSIYLSMMIEKDGLIKMEELIDSWTGCHYKYS